jgi:predicted ATP-binding protein involved in virulence
MKKEELATENDRFRYKGFKLISLEIKNFTFFGNIKYNFIDKDDKQDKIYSTVIIGPNGTRKSLLFNLIIYIFKCICDLKENKEIDYKKYVKGDFHLIYALGNEIYEIVRTHSIDGKKHNQYDYTLSINKEKKEIKDFELPLTIIGNSINITDKFPFYKEKEFDRFQYLGIKYNPQSASTKSYIKKTIDYVAKLSFSESFLNGLKLITETFIGKNKTICISYKTVNYKRFYDGNLNTESLNEFFVDIEKRFKERQKTPPFKLNTYNGLKSKSGNELQTAVEYCNYLAKGSELIKIDGSSSKLLKFNLSKKEDLEKLKLNGEAINNLYSLNLLYDPKIEIFSFDGDEYSLEDSSSGEHNLITSLIGLMATIKPDSLLLIDEPEISLHPNWQMKYVSFLKDVFDKDIYNTSHILIASHSHFIVSDLEGNSSKVIGLSKGQDIEVVPFEKNLNTFGWSAEEVLLKVFKVATSRNYYVAEKLGLMLDFIASEKSTNETIKEKFIELELDKIAGLTNEDPLKTVYDTIVKEYVS